MSLKLVRPTPDDAPALGGILYCAFAELFARHGLPCDFPNEQAAIHTIHVFATRPDLYGVAAHLDGRLVGSNFASYTDAVAGVGPITVDPQVQARGVGKALMQHVIQHALAHHGPQIRLVQDGINVSSLSLYTALGFAVQEPLVLLSLRPSLNPDPTVRRMTPEDLGECQQLCQRIYKVSRANELAGILASAQATGLAPFVRIRQDRIVGYALPGLLGHGVAETNDDLLAIELSGSGQVPPFFCTMLCPVRNADLYRALLRSGARAIRTLNLMSMGPYTSPTHTWCPSIAY